ncbi:MAG TPA: hypothetical protein VFR58_12700 [Flavisolibacter sp.]|nr:hypothetical protein [Flavisolibacter sp.]
MSSGNTINDELNGLNSALPGKPDGTPYAVPEGYFEGLASSVLAKIKGAGSSLSMQEEINQLSPLLAGISRTMPYALPDGYFEQTASILPLLTADENSSLLELAGKGMPYEVPSGYFERLPQLILAKTGKPRGKVVSFGKGWMRAIAAAVVAGAIAFSGLLYSGNDKTATPDNRVAKELKMFSDVELDSFIRNADAQSNPTATRNRPARSGESKRLLKDVSDKELEAFLDQFPTDYEESGIN